MKIRFQGLLSMGNHLVYHSVLFSLQCSHYAVALHIVLDHVNSLAAMLGEQFARQLTHPHDLFGVDSDIRRLTRNASHRWLMNKDPRVWQSVALALCSRRQQQGSHRSTLPEAERDHIRPNELHRVIDRQSRGNGTARAVYVERYVAVRVFGFQK